MGALEQALIAQILLKVGSRPNCRLWRQSTGLALSPDGKRPISFGLKGSADISGILADGRRIEIEVKTSNTKQSAAQVSFQRMIQKMGGVYVVARSVDDVLDVLP